MDLVTLSLTLGFVMIAILLSLWLKLGLERDIVITTLRATVQLLVIGYILKYIFALQNFVFTVFMIFIMIIVATQNVVKRGRGLKGVLWRVLIAISTVEVITQSFILSLGIIPKSARYIIPISGMIIGASMVVASLLINRLMAEVKNRKSEILVLLSLGGTPKQSIRHILKDAIRASMIPTIDSSKTIGLVQLPGMMTGQIIAGADPSQAVRFQLLIVFSSLASSAITSIILGFLIYPSLFNEYQQLIINNDEF